jgi:hypothetical protein
MIMNDGSRHFVGLPETYDVEHPEWHRLHAHAGRLAGATVTGFMTDDVTEAWLDFTYREHAFSVNNQQGEWWFFVADPACPDEILHAVAAHFETLLGPA